MRKKLFGCILPALSLLIVGGLAKADAVLAPFFDTRDGAATYPTVVAKDFQFPAAGPYTTRWLWFFKSSLSELEEECEFTSGSGSQVSNDMTTWDASTGTAFFDPAGSEGTMFPISGQVGMFMVENGETGDEHSMAGEVVIRTTTQQGFFNSSYRMVNDPSATNATNFDDVAYGADPAPAATPQVDVAPLLMWQPSALFSTAWIVSVLDDTMTDTATTNLLVELAVARQSPGSNGTLNAYQTGWYYDRNGNGITTSKTVQVACIGALTLEDLIDVGGLAAAQGNGGWAHLGIVDLDPPNNVPAYGDNRGIIVGKLENLADLVTLYTSENRQDF